VAEVAFGQHDSRRIVIDEIAGYLVAVAYLPPSPLVLLAAFLIFRFFDVVKPYPASWVDRNLPGGAGVVLDDVVAGLYSNLVLHALFFTGFLA
jgi:phosphatidylglycerophosphatase A